MAFFLAQHLYNLTKIMLILIYVFMRQDVDFGKKQKSGAIFFQVGLIAVMVIVLFALEFRFQKESQKHQEEPIVIGSEEPFNINPINIIRVNQSQTKEVAVVKMPRPDNLVKVEVKKNDVKVETEPEKDNSEEMVNNTNDSNNSKVEANTTQSVSGSGNSSGHTFLTVEELPSFPACKGLPRNQQMQCFEEQLRKAVSKNLSYPEDDYESGRQGRAYVEFTINEEGEFSDVKIIESKGAMATKEMNKAAERAVKKLKKINPAKQGDTPVKVKYTLPVTFRIQ